MNKARNVEFQEWNIRFLKVLWATTALAFLAALVLYFKFDDVEHISQERYFYKFVAVPTLMQIVVCILMEILVRKISPHIPNAVTSMLVAVALEMECGVLVMVHTSVGMMAVLLIVPVVLSTVYNSRMIMLVQSLLGCGVYMITQLVIIPNEDYMPKNDAAVYLIIFVALVLAIDLWMDMLIRWQIGINDEVQEYRQKDWEREEEMKKDSLTGLWNHKAFIEQLAERMKQLSDFPGKCVLILFDIDGLYKVNEKYGYTRGDEVILRLTEIMHRNIRFGDYVYRYNGEEFIIILNEATIEISRQIAERIQEEFHACIFENCGNESYTISIGIAEWKDIYTSNLDFVSRVEQALRTAKLNGYGDIGIYE